MRDKIKAIGIKLFNREVALYAIFGVATSVLNVLLFKVLLLLKIDYKVANIITLIVVKLAAYLCNKNFVFKSKCDSFLSLMTEFARFLVARGATALIDFFGVVLMVESFNLNKMFSKVFITILVIVINYIVGEKHVFKKKETKD